VRVIRERAAHRPVARVAVDVPLAHLDRLFDYLVAEADSDAAQPGVRVRVRFAGRLVDGFVIERVDASQHDGGLAMIERVISPEVVLTAQVARLCRAVADRYAGVLADVLRLAVPPRRGRVEEAGRGADLVAGAAGSAPETSDGAAADIDGPGCPAGDAAVLAPDVAVRSAPDTREGVAADSPAEGSLAAPAPDAAGPGDARLADGGEETNNVMPVISDSGGGWDAYVAGRAFLAALDDGRAPRAVWQALPGEDWALRFAEAARVVSRHGRGALLLVPDARDLTRLEAALESVVPRADLAVLRADLGPAERYRRFLAVSRGSARVVAGTRAAAFAPVRDLALVAIFDDGDDLYAEPRAPYPHAREVLAMRSAQEQTALVIGGFARTAEAQLLLRSDWARPIGPTRAEVRRCIPRIEAAGDEYATQADSAAAGARLSPAAFAAARAALDSGAPVLVQVPRRGYLPGMACGDCGRPARCRRCSGPLAVRARTRMLACRWCGVAALRWACPACASQRLRATVIGAARTAEEIGRAFPGARLVTSAGGKVLDRIPAGPAVVVATPGAEPVADGSYGTALLLDGRLMLGRADLRAGEETLRRWMIAATLVRPAAAGGRVVVGTDLATPAVQWLIRWDPASAAETELAQRTELGFPPAVAMASVEGAEPVVGAALAELALPPSADVLGPVPVWAGQPRQGGADPAEGAHAPAGERVSAVERVRALIRVPSADRKALAAALHVLAAARSARKDSEPLRIEIDPVELG
jgi:primosomal protein N' (replication factor Y)